MAGIIAGSSGQNAFGNISQATQAAKQALMNAQGGAEGGEDLEGRVSALEGAAGSAGGGEAAGAGGMTAGALGNARDIFGSMANRQSSVGRGLRA
jgi:hypothetical protein